jgi:hypothetical protein
MENGTLVSATPSGRRRRWPPLLVVTLLIVVAGAGALRWFEQRTGQHAAATAAYDLDAAMDLAGFQVPAEVESFYFFVLDPGADGETGELAQKLVQAAGENDFVGIAGADPEHNREVLRAALALTGARDLKGLIIIYVGPPDHEAELVPLVRATGAQLRFVTYRPIDLETI